MSTFTHHTGYTHNPRTPMSSPGLYRISVKDNPDDTESAVVTLEN